MIVTLVAQTKRFQDGLKEAGTKAQKFGAIVGGAMNLALGALGLLAGSIIFFLPNFIKMGEEARKSELRLGNVAKQMGQFGNETETVTSRLSKYAETLSFTTGVDDDLIRANEAVLLTFSNLGITAKKAGGIFDRALVATLDLAAAGFGTAENNAVQLGKALNDPVKGISALGEAGVTFTQVEKDKIKELVKSNRLLEAQEIVMSAIEVQVGGTAAATASASDKMSAKFESVVEELSLSLLPAVDDISEAMIDWLDSVEGKKAIQNLTDELVAFGDWIASPDGKKAVDDLVGSLKIMADVLAAIASFVTAAADGYQELVDTTQQKVVLPLMERFGLYTPLGTTSTRGPIPGPNTINVNVNAITPGAVVGRTVQQAIRDAERYGSR